MQQHRISLDRTGVFEIMEVNDEMRKLIAENAPTAEK